MDQVEANQLIINIISARCLAPQRCACFAASSLLVDRRKWPTVQAPPGNLMSGVRRCHSCLLFFSRPSFELMPGWGLLCSPPGIGLTGAGRAHRPLCRPFTFRLLGRDRLPFFMFSPFPPTLLPCGTSTPVPEQFGIISVQLSGLFLRLGGMLPASLVLSPVGILGEGGTCPCISFPCVGSSPGVCLAFSVDFPFLVFWGSHRELPFGPVWGRSRVGRLVLRRDPVPAGAQGRAGCGLWTSTWCECCPSDRPYFLLHPFC
jgi:hypothetical protein